MTLPADYLRYPKRRYGMDHDRYDWSILARRKPVAWPGGARIALWIVPALEWFPLDMKGRPVKPPGALTRAYPDYWNYTLRDYGNRVGIFRIMEALDARRLPASVAVNAAVAWRHPVLIEAVVRRGWEVIAHGIDMDHQHYQGLDRAGEEKQIAETVKALREATGQPVRGWLSPGGSESFATLDLLPAHGIEYVCDWANDDMPYALRSDAGPLWAMPHAADIDDYAILVQSRQSEAEFTDQAIAQFDWLYEESAGQGGRIMAISLRPWVIGQPFRIAALEKALDHMLARPGVWPATGAAILGAWKAQQ